MDGPNEERASSSAFSTKKDDKKRRKRKRRQQEQRGKTSKKNASSGKTQLLALLMFSCAAISYFFSYLNSLLFSSQSACVEYHKSRLLNRLEYFDYTLRGLLNLNDRAQEKAKTGQDKHLTYSHCRFEHQKRGESDEDYGGVSSLLVVDFDEYVFCSSAGLSKSHQSGAILNLLDKTHNDQTMIFRRAIDDAAIGIVEVRGGKKKVENELAVVWLVDD